LTIAGVIDELQLLMVDLDADAGRRTIAWQHSTARVPGASTASARTTPAWRIPVVALVHDRTGPLCDASATQFCVRDGEAAPSNTLRPLPSPPGCATPLQLV